MAPDASGAEPHPPGSTIGRYEIVRMLGSGGMGRVYLARDLRLERLVALKCLDPRVAERDTDRGAILREARAAAGLTHPGIAHVYDVIDDQGEIVLVMEYVAGTSLRDRLAAGPCTVEESVRIAATISDALTDAHAAGIVHCDIKPANIQLLSNGSVKILDFGVARRFTLSPQATTLEGQAALGGTPGYMSPEQVFGLPVDQRSDLFSLGIVLFEMLTTRLPFASSANWSDAKRTTRGELATNEAVPEALRQIVYRAIQRDASLRFQNAAEMRDALRTAFPTAAMPAVPPHPHSKRCSSPGPLSSRCSCC